MSFAILRRVFRLVNEPWLLGSGLGGLVTKCLCFVAGGFQLCAADLYVPSSDSPPKLLKEVRAAWVATVGNIDWPSTTGLSSGQQQSELVAILNRAVELKLNTIIFQVRPACDALYASTIEPWSEYLTGTMGKAPEPFYDPLAFAIEEAHKRGLELHAWFNPYRVRHLIAKSPVAPGHISKTRPELVRRYGDLLWLDPGEKAVQEYSLKVVMDVVQRYDIDGVHFDDYFYPYKQQDAAGKELDFPDQASWRRFGAGGKLARDDWRRENVNRFVRLVYESIKATKPWVKFGISPFGIWRPGNPPQVRGFDAYAKLYADSRQWLANGWVDYFCPQLYWEIAPAETSFAALLKWWEQQNAHGRLLCPGLKSYNVGRAWQPWKPEEVANQIRITRSQPGASGHVHWDMKTLMRSGALDAVLEREVYAQPALIPPTPWLERAVPAEPTLQITGSSENLTANWQTSQPEQVRCWVLQVRRGSQWSTKFWGRQCLSCALSGPLPDEIALTAVDRCGNASPPVVKERKHQPD